MVVSPRIVSYYNYTIVDSVVDMKEVMKNVADFDEAIEKLDFLLLRGLELAKDLKIGLSQKIDPAQKAQWLEVRKHTYREWIINVEKHILEHTDRRYYLVHFGNPTRSAVALAGMSMEQSSLVLNIENKLKALEEILIMLEERRNVVIRQDIAKMEHDSSHRYWLKYDDIGGRLYLNDTILLATTRLDSPADRLLQQAFANPNNLIDIDGVTSTQVSSALRDLNITRNLKKIFFPRTAGKKIMFRPFITNTEFVDEKHNEINMSDLRKNEK